MYLTLCLDVNEVYNPHDTYTTSNRFMTPEVYWSAAFNTMNVDLTMPSAQCGQKLQQFRVNNNRECREMIDRHQEWTWQPSNWKLSYPVFKNRHRIPTALLTFSQTSSSICPNRLIPEIDTTAALSDVVISQVQWKTEKRTFTGYVVVLWVANLNRMDMGSLWSQSTPEIQHGDSLMWVILRRLAHTIRADVGGYIGV